MLSLLFTVATEMSVFVRRYAKYLGYMCTSYKTLAMDLCRLPKGLVYSSFLKRKGRRGERESYRSDYIQISKTERAEGEERKRERAEGEERKREREGELQYN